MINDFATNVFASARAKRTIEETVDNNLCTRCGVCYSVCPQHCINFDEQSYPCIDKDSCTECGLCHSVCPGVEFDFRQYYENMYGLKNPVEAPQGYFKKAFIANSNVKIIRDRASSGGIVTQILVYLLREKIVDAVVLVSDNEHDPTSPIPKIARTENEIIAGAGSKYSVVPVSKILNELKKTGEKFAFVGLPCQIHGLRKLESFDKKLSNNLQLVIGLACNTTLEVDAIKDLLWRKGIDESKVKQIIHRDGMFPGKPTVILKDGHSIPLLDYGMTDAFGRLRLMYAPPRCLLCSDYSAEFADISVADIMLRKKDGRYLFPEGRTVTLCRTNAGIKIMEALESAQVIDVAELSNDMVDKNFRKMIMIKKILPYQMIRKLEKKNRLYPDYNMEGKQAGFKYILYESMRTNIFKMFSSPIFRKIGMKVIFSPIGHLLTKIKILWKRRKSESCGNE